VNHPRLRSNNVLAVPRLHLYRAMVDELLDLDARNPARRRRVDEKFGSFARLARRFPSLQDAPERISA
jgi:hypothetical protein